uniref:Uncharacterized protein LOC111127112 n=1 Tax=Crassostrea virginica TaxID=6565 RepID=A0A8B8DJ36_CRAVI|nr:uncharacterized protein LOC111127112 [Crassostrea virginica]
MNHQLYERMQPGPNPHPPPHGWPHPRDINNDGDCLSEVANAFMTGKYGRHWKDRGIKIGFSDWCFITAIILFTAAMFLVGFLFALLMDILSFSFGKDGLFREISFLLRR